jgi:hypothetical protein
MKIYSPSNGVTSHRRVFPAVAENESLDLADLACGAKILMTKMHVVPRNASFASGPYW